MKNNVLVMGTGSIAQRHVKNILKIKDNCNICVCSKSFIRAKNFCKKFKKKNIYPEKMENLSKVNYTHVIIASSSSLHNRHLRKFMFKKNNIYCEKPLPNDKNLNYLTKTIKKRNLNKKIKIGYQFRFNPVIKFLKKELKKKVNNKIYLIKFYCGQNLKNWRSIKNYQKLYSAGKNYLASVNWELSHELDSLNFIYKKPKKIFSSLSSTNYLNLKVKDVSVSTLKFKDPRVTCTITSEMLSPTLYRKLIVITTKNFYEADLVKNSLIKKDFKNKIKKYSFDPDRNYMFFIFMKKFLNNEKKSRNFDFTTFNDAAHITKIQKKMDQSHNKGKFLSI